MVFEKKEHWIDDSEEVLAENFEVHFNELTDPRIAKKTKHSLLEVLFIAVCAYICGASSWTGIYEFSRSRENWLKKRILLENGLPSRITYWRIFSVIDSKMFERCFFSWTHSLLKGREKQIGLDGKALRGYYSLDNPQASLILVSAWATEASLVLGQVKVEEKSNEITALPELIGALDLKETVVTCDAMGCQTEIAGKIVDKGGDYLFALKGNQGTLEDDVRLYFEGELKNRERGLKYDETVEKGHGRIETRKVFVSHDVGWLEQKERWKKLSSIIMIEATRERKGKASTERRFYISSKEGTAKEFGERVRKHWGIESFHWMLDVAFNEDKKTTRNKAVTENLGVLRRIAFNFLKIDKTKGLGMENKRLKAALDSDYLDRLLRQGLGKIS